MKPAACLVGLIGANIMKSLSPALQEDAFAAAGIRGHYHLMDLDRLPGRRLEDVLAAIREVGFTGINVTYPVKQAIIPLLDNLSEEAKQVGAVNTVVIGADRRTTGHNTDRSGFRRGFEEGLGRLSIDRQPVVLVGAGGAGRAVAFALMDLGAGCVVVHDKDAARAAQLVADLQTHFGEERARAAKSLTGEIAAAAGVVNATPMGMLGIPGNPVPAENLRSDLWAADVIYTPVETELLKAARARGAPVLNGTGMLLHQAVDAFRLFTGLEADLPRLRRTLDVALAARDRAMESVGHD